MEADVINNEILISVVIPCYNVEKFVDDCLNSICNQTFKNIEIIAVNDGSKDNTLKHIEEFAKKDKRIKLISQENQGLSEARNVGLRAAKGKYICFIDSDDWVNPDFCKKMFNALEEEKADVAISTMIRKKGNAEKYRVYYTKREVKESLQDKITACNIPKCCYATNKLYKTELIKNFEFKKGVYFEDIIWTPFVLKKADKLVTVPEAIYYYRTNNASIVKVNSEKKQTDSYNAKKTLINFFDENNLKLTEKERTVTKKIHYFKNIPYLKIKENGTKETALLFGIIPLYRKEVK